MRPEPRLPARRELTAEIEQLLPRAFALARQITLQDEDAEDAVGEAVAALLGGRGQYDPTRPLEPYFLRMVTRKALLGLRARRSRLKREEAKAMELHRGAPECERRAEEEERARLVHAALGRLDEEERLAVSLVHLGGCSQTDAAHELGVPTTTLGSRLKRGLDRMRHELVRAGLPATAPVIAGVLAGGREAPVPPRLAARMRRAAAGRRARPARADASAATAKGGIGMKIVAGIALAGAAAGAAVGAGVLLGGGDEPVRTAGPAAGHEEVPHDQKYRMARVVRSVARTLDGPGRDQAETSDCLKGEDIDHAGNWYWTESNYPAVRTYRQEAERVYTLSIRARGRLDGPLDRARFGGWSYNSTNLISVSADGRHLFVLDRHGGGMWRHIDLKAGVVRTVGPFADKPGFLIIVRDKGGEVCAFHTQGKEVPDCPGYRKLKVAPFKDPPKTGWWLLGAVDDCALDAEKMRFYWHCRNEPRMCDLGTGEITVSLTPKGASPRESDTTGPFEGMVWHCPTGMSISPAGRYLFMGCGDGYSFYRLDLQKRHIHVLSSDQETPKYAGHVPRETLTFSFQDGAEGQKKMMLNKWPAAGVFTPAGEGVWANATNGNWVGGLYRLTPAK